MLGLILPNLSTQLLAVLFKCSFVEIQNANKCLFSCVSESFFCVINVMLFQIQRPQKVLGHTKQKQKSSHAFNRKYLQKNIIKHFSEL